MFYVCFHALEGFDTIALPAVLSAFVAGSFSVAFVNWAVKRFKVFQLIKNFISGLKEGFQTIWTMEKKMENIYKRLRGKDGKGISSVEPKLYCTRFQERVVDALIQGDVGEEELQSIREIQALQSILEEEKYITTLEGGERKRILDPEGILKAIWKKIRLPKKKDQDPVSAK